MVDLSNVTAIVTGAGRGLGRAYALALAGAGASVAVNDVDSQAVAETLAAVRATGARGLAIAGSVASWDDSRDLVEQCVSQLGGLDLVVNNAAVIRHAAPWDETEADLRTVMEVNVLGAQFVTRHAMGAMIDRGTGGSILNVVSGAMGGIPGMSSYGASKGAIAALTRNWALEGRPHGIRVNAISPLAQTPMAQADPRHDLPPLPAPESIAPLVVALAGSRARHLTGTIIRFDGELVSVLHGTTLPVDHREAGWSADALEGLLAGWAGDDVIPRPDATSTITPRGAHP